MLFTDPTFLFLFLPLVLTLYYLSPDRAKNGVLLAASLVFYCVGEGWSTLAVLFTIVFNYWAGFRIARARTSAAAKSALTWSIVANLFVLCFFKYAGFLVGNLNYALLGMHLKALETPKVHLPLGISFFTFHALSYIIDIWRTEVKPMKRASSFALYILLFPQLIAGPIIRFKIIRDQFDLDENGGRRHTWDGFAEGVRRFVIGFGKKMLIANTVAQAADMIFGINPRLITPGCAWLGVVCYTLQIYFDFSGYTDMAIGLGKMFGFTFPENFNYPYIASSITDFWRRWHMTLSSWFRDYLYIPMGGNRVPTWRIYFNLLTVFFLCGLWHGPQWTFVIWGLFHGLFLIVERIGLTRWLQRHAILRHLYVLPVVMVGWVLFRATTLQGALVFLARMIGSGAGAQTAYSLHDAINRPLAIAILAGIIGSVPLVPWLAASVDRFSQSVRGWTHGLAMTLLGAAEFAALAVIFLGSTALSAAGTYNPFIYFRF